MLAGDGFWNARNVRLGGRGATDTGRPALCSCPRNRTASENLFAAPRHDITTIDCLLQRCAVSRLVTCVLGPPGTWLNPCSEPTVPACLQASGDLPGADTGGLRPDSYLRLGGGLPIACPKTLPPATPALCYDAGGPCRATSRLIRTSPPLHDTSVVSFHLAQPARFLYRRTFLVQKRPLHWPVKEARHS